MFNALWKSLSGEEEERVKRYEEQLKQLLAFYPIGEKINYYPEYLEDVNFETIVLGYELNEKPIYARDHVRGLDDALSFFVEESDETLTAADLSSFALIVPDTSELEKTLDYNSKAVIGRSGQFVRGNSITLVSAATEQGTPIVDTTVLRRTQVKQGFYQNYKVVVLDPKLESMTYKENRQQSRMELSLPCTLSNSSGSKSGLSGTLIDCSELCVGVELPKLQSADKAVARGMPVWLSISISKEDKTFELAGEVFAIRSSGTVVVKLQKIKKADKFEDLELVDRLDLRASFVQSTHDKPAGGSGQLTRVQY